MKAQTPERSINSFLSSYTPPFTLSSPCWCIVEYEGSCLFNSLDLYRSLLLQTNSLTTFFFLGGHSYHKTNQQTSSQAGEDGRHKSTMAARVYQGPGSTQSQNQHANRSSICRAQSYISQAPR